MAVPVYTIPRAKPYQVRSVKLSKVVATRLGLEREAESGPTISPQCSQLFQLDQGSPQVSLGPSQWTMDVTFIPQRRMEGCHLYSGLKIGNEVHSEDMDQKL